MLISPEVKFLLRLRSTAPPLGLQKNSLSCLPAEGHRDGPSAARWGPRLVPGAELCQQEEGYPQGNLWPPFSPPARQSLLR